MEKVQSITGFGNVVPTFLLKLLNLLQEPQFHDYVSWNKDGTSFVVHDQANFSKHVLPKYFKHNKFSSFVRQLNMYGFRKVTTVSQGGLAVLHEAIEFHHPFFIRGEEDLLQYIKRKVTQPTSKPTDDLTQVLDDMHEIKDTQIGISNSLSELKRENEDLWREVVSLRQKHLRQQKVVNHLIKFLVSLVQHHGMGMKRKMPLMIDDGSGCSQPSSKITRTNENVGPSVTSPSSEVFFNTMDSNPSVSTEGPLITELLSSSTSPAPNIDLASTYNVPTYTAQELTDEANSEFDIANLIDFADPTNQAQHDQSSSNRLQPQHKESAHRATSSPNHYFNVPASKQANVSTVDDGFLSSLGSVGAAGAVNPANPAVQNTPVSDNGTNQSLVITSGSGNLNQSCDTDDLNANIDLIQNNLNHIQRRLSNNEQVQLDYDLIQELFNGSIDITPSPNVIDPSLPTPVPVHLQQPAGNELVQYNNEAGDGKDAEDDMNKFLELLK